MFAVTIWEFYAQKKTLKPFESEQMVYAAVADDSNIDDLVLKRMDEEFRKKFGGQTLDEFLEKL